MIQETTYSEYDLKSGECKCCGEFSKEIIKWEKICIDCKESNDFYDQSMRMWEEWEDDPY